MWQPVMAVAGPALLAGLLTWAALELLGYLGRVQRSAAALTEVQRQLRLPLIATVMVAAAIGGLAGSGLGDSAEDMVRRCLVLGFIAAMSWLAIRALIFAQRLAFRHLQVDVRDNRKARRVRTQISVLQNLAIVVVVVIALAAMLMTFDRLRAYGASLLASAGLLGIVAGVALQGSLRNVFAGLQLAFSDTLRIDDVVVVEDEWGRVESLSLMSVTVHLWDERRLILPATYFTTTPFQNWTRTESRILGSIYLHVDYTVPMTQLRREAHRLIDDSPLWDRRDWVLQVVEAAPSTVVVRVLASAYDAASAWDLRCDVREGLLDWLQREHPTALPRMRAEVKPLFKCSPEYDFSKS